MSVTLKYPRKSHRKEILYPPESISLAEFFGVIFGDGGINSSWQLVISLNSESDFVYSRYISQLLRDLFNLEPTISKRLGKELSIVCSSVNLVDFLVGMGAVKGNKIRQQFGIPDWILGNKDYEKAFVKGLVDTDGCLFINHHKVSGRIYKNIGFCFTSFSNPLLRNVGEILRSSGLKPHIAYHKGRIHLYSYKAVIEYLNIFGTSNPRIMNKYLEWKDIRLDKFA